MNSSKENFCILFSLFGHTVASRELASCFLRFDLISVRNAESAKLKAIANDMLDFIF